MSMSDTPRTDAAMWNSQDNSWMDGTLCRTLERELTAANQRCAEKAGEAAGLRIQLTEARAEIERLRGEVRRLKVEIGMAYKEAWTEGFACDGHAVYGFEGQRDADFEKSRAKRITEGKE